MLFYFFLEYIKIDKGGGCLVVHEVVVLYVFF